MKTDLCHKILAWLVSCQVQDDSYDHGGIFDPLDKRVIGDHYAATHVAWACALFFRRTHDPELMRCAKKAIDFHIRTSPEEYPPGNWNYHWDFNNLGFIETFGLLSDELPPHEKEVWIYHLLTWKTNSHHAVNWMAMRGLAAYRRGILLERLADISTAKDMLDRVLAAQTKDGCFDDIAGQSRPSQYHAYTACLLLQMQHIDSKRILSACIKAARWLLKITSPDGDMNALGRGQGQIFGYACAVYLFNAAKFFDPELAPHYQWVENQIVHRLNHAVRPEGFLPLVLNDCEITQKAGWYDYHHLSVYNAFALVWLYLAQGEGTPKKQLKPEPLPYHRTCHKASRLFCVREKWYSFLFAAGETGAGYASDAGISPHYIYFTDKVLFRYPLGPGPGKYGKTAASYHQEENIWAPLIKANDRWIAPFSGKGSLDRQGENTIVLTYQIDDIVWKRKIHFGANFIDITDCVDLSSYEYPVESIRIVNLALKKKTVTRTGPFFLTLMNGQMNLSVWGSEHQLEHKREVRAANGIVDIYGLETGKKTAIVQGGFRLRRSPCQPKQDIPPIVCMTWDPWTDIWKRKQRIMYDISRQGQGCDVLYIEPAKTSTSIVENAMTMVKKSSEGRRYQRALSGKMEQIDDHFFLYTPVLPFPGNRTWPAVKVLNQKSMVKALRKKIDVLNFKEYVLWLYHPSQLWMLDFLNDRAELIVYDWTDDWVAAYPDHLPENEKKVLQKNQNILLARCDLVFCVSLELCRRARQFCPNVYYLPNATDPGIFKPAAENQSRHPVFKGKKSPFLVYLSQITPRLDIDLLSTLAARQPEWNFLLIGPVICPESLLLPLKNMKNINFTGSLAYQQAAQIVAQSDVCILPHTQDELTKTLDPIKLYDYLATGKPIVATNVAMHADIKQYISIVTGVDEFERAVISSIHEPKENMSKRRNAAMNHVWKKRSENAIAILEQFF
jgi:glycosyltransferase involved in cell wall biosynthesis